MDQHCRIGRVKPKGNLAIMPGGYGDMRDNVVMAGRETANILPDIEGYVVLGWERNASRFHLFYNPGQVHERQLADFVADMISYGQTYGGSAA